MEIKKQIIYLDNNATAQTDKQMNLRTLIAPEIAEAWLQRSEVFAILVLQGKDVF